MNLSRPTGQSAVIHSLISRKGRPSYTPPPPCVGCTIFKRVIAREEGRTVVPFISDREQQETRNKKRKRRKNETKNPKTSNQFYS